MLSLRLRFPQTCHCLHYHTLARPTSYVLEVIGRLLQYENGKFHRVSTPWKISSLHLFFYPKAGFSSQLFWMVVFIITLVFHFCCQYLKKWKGLIQGWICKFDSLNFSKKKKKRTIRTTKLYKLHSFSISRSQILQTLNYQ